MIDTSHIIQNLEAARRLAFPDFEKIVLEPAAVRILVHAFLHPGCKADVNLATFLTGAPVLLSDISPHIITAFPSQVALFARRKGTTTVSAADLLECYALDHADQVEENQIALAMEPSYALAHVLTIGTVKNIRGVGIRQLIDLEALVCRQRVTFSHVLVPTGVSVKNNSVVFHHFGVVLAAADTKALRLLARKLQLEQNKKSFLRKITKQIIGANISSIDYAKESFFKVDMTGKLIKESKKDFDFQKLWQEEDLQKIKIPKEARVMFQS